MKMKTATMFAALCAASLGFSAEWKPAPATISTKWGADVSPENALREYPRPQFVRHGAWQNLNGLWDYAVLTDKDDFDTISGPVRGPKRFDGKILVPFAIESSLSGVGRTLEPNERLWYSRTIDVKPEKGRRTLLNFEAVDFRAQVFLNGVEVLDVPHEGMNTPFSVDITPFARPGENLLQVAVWDPTTAFIGSSGKQSFKPHGCFYTRVSGIWQTVWTESVPDDYISSWKVTSDVSGGTVRFDFETSLSGRAPVSVEILDGGKVVARGVGGEAIRLPAPVKLWTPDSPNLYDVRFSWKEDRADAYFAMRSLSLVKDVCGTLRFALNGKPLFLQGTLDQGWWPESLLTPPSEEAMAFDIKMLKDAGFNMMRKHIKVEPRRYYALCDRMGLMVLQDMPSGAGDHVNRYGLYRRELKDVVDHLVNVPSIVMWVPYNEGWGQPAAKYTVDTLAWVKRYDPTRLVDGPSGWTDFEDDKRIAGGGGVSEAVSHAVDMHSYPGPGMHPVNPRRASLLGEFGGIGYRVEGHLWKPAGESWGYVSDAELEKSFGRYAEISAKLAVLARDGLAGSVYTQTTDVELEINGLATYDRKVVKYDLARLRELHEAVYRSADEGASVRREAATVFPRQSDGWSYSFDGREWKTGRAGFGNDVVKEHAGANVATGWTTGELWARRKFEWSGGKCLTACVDMFHDEDVELFVNGTKIFSRRGFNTSYQRFSIDLEAFKGALREGENEFSAHVVQTSGGQYFDCALIVERAL
jgi:hypothetical protein